MSGGEHRQEDEINGFAIAIVGIAVAIVLYASIVALQAYYKGNPVASARQMENKSEPMRNLRASQQATLQGSAYVGGNDFASMPIKSAMRKVVADEKANRAVLVPSVGGHNKATVPATPGKPAEAVAVPEGAGVATPTKEETPAAKTPKPAAKKPAAGAVKRKAPKKKKRVFKGRKRPN